MPTLKSSFHSERMLWKTMNNNKMNLFEQIFYITSISLKAIDSKQQNNFTTFLSNLLTLFWVNIWIPYTEKKMQKRRLSAEGFRLSLFW